MLPNVTTRPAVVDYKITFLFVVQVWALILRRFLDVPYLKI